MTCFDWLILLSNTLAAALLRFAYGPIPPESPFLLFVFNGVGVWLPTTLRSGHMAGCRILRCAATGALFGLAPGSIPQGKRSCGSRRRRTERARACPARAAG